MRRLVALVGAVALAAALSYPTLAAPTTLYAMPQQIQTYRIIEQQSPGPAGDGVWPPDSCTDPSIVYEGVICNRTVDPAGGQCIWDVDDHTDVYFSGSKLGPGQEASWTRCLIADSFHLYGMQQGDHNMTLTITIEAGGVVQSISTTGSKLCMQGMIILDWDNPLKQVIPNSDGGTGIPGSITYSVRNDTNRTERYGPSGSQTSAGSGLRGWPVYEDRYCPSGRWLHENGQVTTDPVSRTAFAWEVP